MQGIARIAAISGLILTAACTAKPSSVPVTTLPAAVMVQVVGTASYRERIALMPGLTMIVRVADISLADAPAKVLAEQRIVLDGRQVPLPFALDVPRADLTAAHQTTVSVELRNAEGRLEWITDTIHPVTINSGPLGANVGELRLVRVMR